MDIATIKKRLEREQARQREAARRAQALGAKLSTVTRANDTRRKVLAGSWTLHKLETSEEFRAMVMRELDRVWLSRDDDRALFGLEPLGDDEKVRRERHAGKRAPRNGGSTGEVSDGAGEEAPRADVSETEAA